MKQENSLDDRPRNENLQNKASSLIDFRQRKFHRIFLRWVAEHIRRYYVGGCISISNREILFRPKIDWKGWRDVNQVGGKRISFLRWTTENILYIHVHVRSWMSTEMLSDNPLWEKQKTIHVGLSFGESKTSVPSSDKMERITLNNLHILFNRNRADILQTITMNPSRDFKCRRHESLLRADLPIASNSPYKQWSSISHIS